MPATPNTNKPAVHRLTCPQCKTRFRTKSTKAIFCTRTCKDKATATKRRIKYVGKATDSAFFKQLAFEASRAGTLEIFTGHTAESLAELYKVYAFKLKANQYGKSTDYELSHICAAQGDDAVGLYHPLNLVVAPKALNRAHGTQHFGYGLSIARGSLKSRHTVEKGANQKDTVTRIVQFIGADIVAQAVKLAGIKPQERSVTLAWLRDHLIPSVPEHRDWLDGLEAMQTPALKALRAKLEGKEVNGFTIKTTILRPCDVLSQELERHAQHRPELTQVLDVICKRTPEFTALHMSRIRLNARELQAVFDVLHGASVDAIRTVLTDYVERITGVSAKPDVPALAVRVLATLKSPVLGFTAGARSFAECLDGEEVSVGAVQVPVLVLSQAYSVPQSVEPLPWD